MLAGGHITNCTDSVWLLFFAGPANTGPSTEACYIYISYCGTYRNMAARARWASTRVAETRRVKAVDAFFPPHLVDTCSRAS